MTLSSPDGAFEIGGGSTHYGQDYTEAAVRNMFAIPAPNPLNALNLLQDQLAKLPLEALQLFKDLIPDPIEDMFETVGGAVDAIMGALTNNPLFLAISTFQQFLEDLWNNPGEVINQIGQDMVDGLVELSINVGQAAQDFSDFLAELWADPGAVISQIGQDMVDGLDGIILGINTAVGAVASDLSTLLGDLWSNAGAVIGGITKGMVAGLEDSLDFLNAAWNQLGDIVQGIIVTPITEGVARFQDWWASITQGVQQTVDDAADFANDLWSGLMRALGVDKSSADVSNAANELSKKAKDSIDLGEWNNAILGVRNNKSIMQGVDETEESTFLMSDLFTGASAPPSMDVTSAAVPVAFWRATEWATKGFISWFGEGYTNVTGIYIDLYKLNYDTSVMELFHSSGNLDGLADATWKYAVYYMDEADRFEVFPGDVIGVGLRVTGSGTHKVAAKSAPWLPGHPTVVPAKPSATRTGSGNLAFGSITYSTDLPWFGIGIVAGDTPPLFFTPRTEAFDTAGANTYTIPEWAQELDVVLVGAGGGGHGGHFFGTGGGTKGEGGDAGVWAAETLVRGVDFPVDATTLTINVGAGGVGGGGFAVPGTPGPQTAAAMKGQDGTSSSRSAIASGKAVFSAAGGLGATVLTTVLSSGESPGNFTYGGTNYIGGGTAPAVKGNPTNGKPPGGGGAGGAHDAAAEAGWGGSGGRGGAWVTARQS